MKNHKINRKIFLEILWCKNKIGGKSWKDRRRDLCKDCPKNLCFDEMIDEKNYEKIEGNIVVKK